MRILGISAFYHDSAAALIEDGNIIAAAQEERFTRKKHDPGFPVQAIAYCLDTSGTSIDELDAIAFYDKPLLKFERLLETYYAFAPKGIRSFITSMPVWIKEKLFLKKMILDELKKIEPFNKKKVRLLFPEHHLSHAASAYYPAPYDHAAILTIDGVGEWATASIMEGKGLQIKVLKELHFPHSPGLLYSAFTYYLGFRVNSGEYKLMGLAPYGNPEAAETRQFINIIKNKLVHIKPDGSIWLNSAYFNYATGLHMTRNTKWEKLFGFARRLPEKEEINSHHCNLALAIQTVTEEIVLAMAAEAKLLTGADNLCLAGGVALNCVANGKLEKAGLFKNVYIQPAAGDAGGAPGAALAAYYIYFEKARSQTWHERSSDGMQGSYLGPEPENAGIERMARKYKAHFIKYEDFESLCAAVSGYINEGNVIGWVQGRMEFGPRALGNRSILADARNEDMQKKLNLKIKFRESFRPFAPAVLAEDAHLYFDMDTDSPYMLKTFPVHETKRFPIPENYVNLDIKDKLYTQRSELQAITHIDFSARVQTVHRQTNPRFYALLQAFKKLTGCSVLVNTSFNVRGEPIVNTAEDAYRCFMRTDMDYLVLNDYIFAKEMQPAWKGKDDWKNEFTLD